MYNFEDYISFLDENRCGFLATVSENRPKVRPWSFLFESESKIWFMTTNAKRVFSELKANPYIEFCVMSDDYISVRLAGKIEFSDDIDIKSRILMERPILKEIYKTHENPLLEVFYLEHGSLSFYASKLNIHEFLEF